MPFAVDQWKGRHHGHNGVNISAHLSDGAHDNGSVAAGVTHWVVVRNQRNYALQVTVCSCTCGSDLCIGAHGTIWALPGPLTVKSNQEAHLVGEKIVPQCQIVKHAPIEVTVEAQSPCMHAMQAKLEVCATP